MKQVYIILGYGIPRNILKDGNYQYYLRGVFNSIYDDTVTRQAVRPIIIFCGGKSDIFKPYRRTEAAEMMRAFRALMAKPVLRKATRNWKLVPEPRSISTLENLLYARGILRSMKTNTQQATIYCEQTRVSRIVKLARKIFSKSIKANVKAIDFDTSNNRYLDLRFLTDKEHKSLRHDLWALRNDNNMKQHHEFFVRKLVIFRKAGPGRHVATIRKWWEDEMKKEFIS